MDFNLIVICSVAVVGVTEWIKSLDTKQLLSNFYKFIPALLSVGVAVILVNFLSKVWYFGFIYWGCSLGIAVIGYETIVKLTKRLIMNYNNNQ